MLKRTSAVLEFAAVLCARPRSSHPEHRYGCLWFEHEAVMKEREASGSEDG
jgi:hypothetical protein